MKPLQVREHDLLVFHECINNDDLDFLTVEDVNQLKKLEPSLPAGLVNWLPRGVKFRNYCGVISLKNSQIEILPKIYGLESRPGSCREALIIMLCETDKISPKISGEAFMNQQKAHLFDFFISIFCRELFYEVHRGLIKTYIRQVKTSGILKGKLLFEKQIKQGIIRKDQLVCRVEELSINNLYNQYIKTTLWHLLGLKLNLEVKRDIHNLIRFFDGVDCINLKLIQNMPLAANRFWERYKTILLWCQRFLRGLSQDVLSGVSESISLLFNMNQLFEEYLSVKIKQIAPEIGLSTSKPGEFQYLATWKEKDKNMFRLIPDLLIQDKESKCILAVIDMKWKIPDFRDKSWSMASADLYQILTYMNQYSSDLGVILFPSSKNRFSTMPTLLIKKGGQKVLIRMIDLGGLVSKKIPTVKKQILDILEEIIKEKAGK